MILDHFIDNRNVSYSSGHYEPLLDLAVWWELYSPERDTVFTTWQKVGEQERQTLCEVNFIRALMYPQGRNPHVMLSYSVLGVVLDFRKRSNHSRRYYTMYFKGREAE